MQLLPLKEIKIMKGKERQLEINEGIKLASKVDALRATASKEQADLIKFRDENVKKILGEIKEYAVQKDSLIEDIKGLEQRRQEALKPLDEKEKQLDSKEKDLTLLNNQLEIRQSTFDALEKTLANKTAELKVEEERIIDTHTEVRKIVAETQIIRNQMRLSLEEADRIKNQTITEVQQKSDELQQRETILAGKERDIKVKEGIIEEQTKEIIIIKLQLADQRATLERAFNRLNK